MKEPIWIRERRPPEPPPLSLHPVLTIRKRGIRQIREVRTLIGRLPHLLAHVGGERDSASIEIILMRYRLLILLFSVSILKP
ncbi:hypothetical protein [Candidatus Manganitrophus noduliformans]|uniref:Uncharacterized protein n=1 Tax=Candidatus Manganitrophus noduliformans TaxID=2606439 RepID=A0A7X6DMR4_9BACT|nr:hypothetical protein [Candidatus Manganitrophus noduliformans]NKE70093.1 hypothetical protein [Candidatus Manganitrophus noduliformans]